MGVDQAVDDVHALGFGPFLRGCGDGEGVGTLGTGRLVYEPGVEVEEEEGCFGGGVVGGHGWVGGRGGRHGWCCGSVWRG